MLNNSQVIAAKPKDKAYKMSDGKGLYLLINKSGAKYWRYSYRFAGKQKTLALGVYPDISLKRARELHIAARLEVINGADPCEQRREKIQAVVEVEQKKQAAIENRFQAVAEEWLEVFKPRWTKGHHEVIERRLKANVYQWIGDQDIATIRAPEVLTMLRKIELRGAPEVARRVRMICGQVFDYAISIGKSERNPARDLRNALTPRKSGHFAALTEPKQVGGMLRCIDAYEGAFITRCALQFMALTFIRGGELRYAEWPEIDGDTWVIPADKMKMSRDHIVPLSKQAQFVLEQIKPLTGHAKYIFHGMKSETKPMSENTLNSALRRMGYTKEEMTSHGFRTTASTLLNELGFNRDWIELQLSHVEKNAVRGAYNRAEHLAERRTMMQAYADYLDKLRQIS